MNIFCLSEILVIELLTLKSETNLMLKYTLNRTNQQYANTNSTFHFSSDIISLENFSNFLNIWQSHFCNLFRSSLLVLTHLR